MATSVGLLVVGDNVVGLAVEKWSVGTCVGAMLDSIGFILGASVTMSAAVGFMLGASVTGLSVVLSTVSVAICSILGALVTGLSVVLWSVGMSVGAGDGRDVGFVVVGLRVGLGVSFGAGRHGVNAMHVMPSLHSVSWPEIHGEWQFFDTSAQSLPQKYECRMSSAGITGDAVGGKLDVGTGVGLSVGALVAVVGVTVGDTVGAVGVCDGVCVGTFVGGTVGLLVMSEALHPIPP